MFEILRRKKSPGYFIDIYGYGAYIRLLLHSLFCRRR